MLTGIILLGTILYQEFGHMPYSLDETLSYYDFRSQNQKEALKNLCQNSPIIPKGQSWQDTFPGRKTLSDLAPDILAFIKGTQTYFTIRQGNQERWHVKGQEWMETEKEKNLSDLKVLGFVDAIKPRARKADAICILGATRKRMVDRLEFADLLIKEGFEAKSIILLAGERYATKDIDGTEEELSEISKAFQIESWTRLTETHLLKDAYHHSALVRHNLESYIIDTPKGDLPRPTTQTTILQLIQWLEDHQDIKSIVFISNQPYVKYQQAIIHSIFKEKGIEIQFEVVGSGASTENIHPILEGLGSYIWAISPIVVTELGIDIQDPLLRDTFHELYKKHPLIYKILPLPLKK